MGMHWFDRIRHPEGFHGRGVTRKFFEGWYFKQVSNDGSVRLAVIPGVFLGLEGGGEAFVQVLDGVTGRSWYHRYDVAAFDAAEDRIDVKVGPNRFSPEGITLDLPAVDGSGALSGSLRFGAFQSWPVTWTRPGVMGPFAWAPFMECYHGVTGLDHRVDGTLTLDGTPLVFDDARGYSEKDWGRAFPKAYVWMQGNSFERRGVSFMGSIAHIPWLGLSFPGFLVGLQLDGKLFPFATYTGARTRSLAVDDGRIEWVVEDRQQVLTIRAERARGGLLHAPVRTEMHRRVEETMDARLHVTLVRKSGETLFDGTTPYAALEVHGEPATLGASGVVAPAAAKAG